MTLHGGPECVARDEDKRCCVSHPIIVRSVEEKAENPQSHHESLPNQRDLIQRFRGTTALPILLGKRVLHFLQSNVR